MGCGLSSATASGASALSYIPEKVWNDTSAAYGLAAGGGGTSVFFPRPVWQTGPGVPNDSFRHVPDLSIASSPADPLFPRNEVLPREQQAAQQQRLHASLAQCARVRTHTLTLVQ